MRIGCTFSWFQHKHFLVVVCRVLCVCVCVCILFLFFVSFFGEGAISVHFFPERCKEVKKIEKKTNKKETFLQIICLHGKSRRIPHV